MASKQVLTNNCFGPIPPELLASQCEPIVYEKIHKSCILVPRSKQIGDNAKDCTLVYEAVDNEEYDIQEYINSFADEVGIQNILKKLSISGDKSLLNQTGREALCPDGGLEPIQDYSNVPKNKTEAFNAVVKGVNAFDELPDDVKGKMSMEQFVKFFGQDEFDAYINKVVAAMQPKEEDK